jgi:methylmalonyl-CoA mutase N-terminal domain/subunit
MQQEIGNAAYEYQKDLEEGNRILVGVNKFTENDAVQAEVFRVDDSIRKVQTDKLNKLKAERNSIAVEKALSDLAKAAAGTENLMPHILTAVEAYATLGEIADTLRKEFGEY